MSVSVPAVFREANNDDPDGHPNPMEILDVSEADTYDGWVVEATKCRRGWRRRVREAGYRIHTISPRGNSVWIHVRGGGGE